MSSSTSELTCCTTCCTIVINSGCVYIWISCSCSVFNSFCLLFLTSGEGHVETCWCISCVLPHQGHGMCTPVMISLCFAVNNHLKTNLLLVTLHCTNSELLDPSIASQSIVLSVFCFICRLSAIIFLLCVHRSCDLFLPGGYCWFVHY